MMKGDKKTKRMGVSPARTTTRGGGIKQDKSNKRLLERVEKAISEQAPHFIK